ncbi:2-C-methyl-D-erythritol 2,4-cyclodiphosphate synthase [candidate division KSB1 bacterium]|nr:2-C-methyl-D-erythritol 2,4-cyclodiphosphate synthase [candidate division KSB1 bacterium]
MRIGIGYDVHRLVVGRKLILGGVELPFEKGLLGHSDADVLCHAIGDAMLGAAALGDLGTHFPDTNPRYAGISSLILLAQINQLIQSQNYQLVNVDAVIIAEKPKIMPYVPQMKKNLAPIIELPETAISIKATTSEGLGFTGEGLGMAAYAVVLLNSKTN